MNSPIWTALDYRRLTADDALDVVVRRPAGTTPAMLETLLRPALDDYARQLPITQRRVMIGLSGVEGTPLARQMSFVLPYVLAVSVLLTLLIACANVAVLMIAQWTSREHEIAIRAAIGASRGRIVRSLLTESVVLAAIGGLLGVGVALGLRAVILHNSGESGFYDLSIDISVLVWAAVITLLTGIVAGVAPALYETRRLHANPLRTMAGSDRVRQRWRHALVVFEITVTVALLVQTMSLVNGYLRATNGIMGFETQPLLNLRVENPGGVPAKHLLEVLKAIPGVDGVAASTAIPFSARGPNERVAISAAGDNAVVAERAAISPTFFTTLGVALRAGRPFADNEPSTMRTIIVNEALARRLFTDRSAVGATVWLGDAPYDVVGVAADYSRNPMQDADAQPRIFVPLPDTVPRRLAFVFRATGSGTTRADDSARSARCRGWQSRLRRRDVRSGHPHHRPGDHGRHRAARPADHDRNTADDGGYLRRAGVRREPAGARTGDSNRDRRERPRSRAAGHDAHAAPRLHWRRDRDRPHVRPQPPRARRGRRGQHLRSDDIGIRRSGRRDVCRRRGRDLDSGAPCLEDRSVGDPENGRVIVSSTTRTTPAAGSPRAAS